MYAKHFDSVGDILTIEIVPMNFISYQKLVKMVKDVYYAKSLFNELGLEIGFNWHCLCKYYLNPLPDNKILTLSKLKAFADNKINVT